jgi:NTP pyrophosphatase (non-canonical NTP hydrolase)
MEIVRQFSDENLLQKCLLLGEEVGEVFKSVRRFVGMRVEAGTAENEVAAELADVMIVLCTIANRLEVNLEVALRMKEYRNQLRLWSVERPRRP